MQPWTSDPAAITAVVLLTIFVIAAIVWFVTKQGKAHRLKSYFGKDEYDRTVRRIGNRRRAEAELEQRRRRVSRYLIRSLHDQEVRRFSNDWRAVQLTFVDNPDHAVRQADRLVEDVMTASGYPMTDFDIRAADISVEHPRVVENYRIAKDIARRQARGEAHTEELRRAMVYYRELLEDLLGPTPPKEVHHQ